MPADDARFTAADSLSWNDVGDELTLFDRATGGYFALNGGAVAIWRQLTAGLSVSEVVDALAAQFDVPRDTMASDVTAFVHDALARNLLAARE